MKNAELKAHLVAINERAAANGHGFRICEDVEYWAEDGINTVEEFERCMLTSEISDLHKDVHGYRCRIDFSEWTMEEMQSFYDDLIEEGKIVWAREEAQKLEDVASFKAQVQAVIDAGAGDEETALRWMTQEEEFYNGQDIEHWVWKQNILFTDYGRDLMDKLRGIVEFKEMECA